ncbi:transcriptional regulator, XRE family [Paenibacillus curdlanolyticus YK9]|uniref:Transcriptional regulator, XRE family n=1 Tax=Paenibacillus curdlanolyticus YK9 TaxID=717606 RepID=E0I4B5_9BACL|nr:RodZ domain-containing protein [Paenibacillus curdlanolyticus]EFM13129.1 transcriptional regulator, XRE family [Paenibacillus curdlanolyticus YK9]
MSDLGDLLKKAREQRELSLDDIQEATKIRKRYLEAIESGDYKVLPGSFYVRAFVKTYAEAVGLDADDVLRLYKHEMPEPAPEPVTESVVKQPRRSSQTSSDRWSKFGFTGIMLSFVVVIAVIIWVYAINTNDNTDDTPKADDQTKITDSTDLPKEPVKNADSNGTGQAGTSNGNSNGTGGNAVTPETPTTPETPSNTTVTFASKSGRTDHYDVGPAGSHTVQITIKGGKNWLEVREGSSKGKKLVYENAADGTVQSFPLNTSLYINVGRADLVEIAVDGVAVEDGDRASSKRVQFDPVKSDNPASNNQAGTTDTGATDAGTGNNAAQ